MNRKFTPWFNAAQEPPTRRGDYPVRNLAHPGIYGPRSTRYWTGSRWLVTKGGQPSNFGQGLTTGATDEWRGLLKRPGPENRLGATTAFVRQALAATSAGKTA